MKLACWPLVCKLVWYKPWKQSIIGDQSQIGRNQFTQSHKPKGHGLENLHASGKKRDTNIQTVLNVAKTKHVYEELKFISYLKDFFIKYSSSKHYNSLGIDDGAGASEQPLGGLLFTVQNEGDGLLVHTDGHSMPSERGGEVNSHTYWVTSCPATHC